MKIILTVMCGLVVFFGGTCVILSGQSFSNLGLLILAVVLLNAAVLAAIYGIKEIPTWPLYLLAAVDFLIAAGCGYGVVALPSSGSTGGVEQLLYVPLVITAAKGLLTVLFARSLKTNI